MTTNEEKTEETQEEERHGLLEAARKVLLAAIGVMALAQDEIEEFVNKLIERGEIAEKDGKKLIEDLKQKRKKKAKDAEMELNKRIDQILAHANIPSKSDMQSLSDKIAELSEKIAELKQAQEDA